MAQANVYAAAVLTLCPGKLKKPGKAQKAQWDRFREAAAYATGAAEEDPEVWAYYRAEAERLDRQPHLVARTDYLTRKNLLARK
jgi:hypothetical protein